MVLSLLMSMALWTIFELLERTRGTLGYLLGVWGACLPTWDCRRQPVNEGKVHSDLVLGLVRSYELDHLGFLLLSLKESGTR
jgi:hypothetical protein